jgi:hypothetical protein
MLRLIKTHFLFLAIAVLIAFAIVPLDQMYFDHLPVEEVKQYYRNAFSFESGKAWKLVFTWFLGLSCGRLMLKALANN